MPSTAEMADAVCLDVGSAWTKAVLVHPDGGIGEYAEHPTTHPDLYAGMDAAVGAITTAVPSRHSRGPVDVLACSSAGGGLPLAVVADSSAASAEVGIQVVHSTGARVVHLHVGPLQPGDLRLLCSSKPGVVLLIGGADGDDPTLLLHNAHRLATATVRFPIVFAGNAAVRDEVLALLHAAGRTVLVCDNVTPRQGELVPGSARAALTTFYDRHVLGSHPTRITPQGRSRVQLTTPEAVGRGVAELARLCGSAVLVVDVGCATTDVHSARPDTGHAHRSVEGDLGIRVTAEGVLAEGQAEGLVDPVEADLLAPTVARLSGDVGYLPTDAGSAAEDRRIAMLAALLALRRHVREHDDDVANVGLVVLSGGVFRQRPAAGRAAVVATLRGDRVLGPVLHSARVVVDADFALAPAGLLVAHGRLRAAAALLLDHVLP